VRRRRVSVLLAILVEAACHRDSDRAADDDDHDERGGEGDHRIPGAVRLGERVIEDAGITTEVVRELAVAETVRLTGEVVADPDRRTRIAARLSGVVESTGVRPGDPVAEGDVIVVVRAPNLQTLRATEAGLRARAASARANAERLESLEAKRMVSRQEVVAAKAEAEALEGEARAARDRLRAIGLKNSTKGAVLFDVRAPAAGVVIDRPVAEGEPVTEQSVVATLVELDRVWFEGQVFERDLGRLVLGAKAFVELTAYPGEQFEGNVEYVAHQTDPGARTLSVRIPLTNRDDKLRLGLFGSAAVVTDPGTPTTAVPSTALTTIEGRDVVFVARDEHTFEPRRVIVGRRDPEHAEITDGVRRGEQVVSGGVFSVKSVFLADTFAEDHH
jgi:membrane fusion protein, heavy metal efflux system